MTREKRHKRDQHIDQGVQWCKQGLILVQIHLTISKYELSTKFIFVKKKSVVLRGKVLKKKYVSRAEIILRTLEAHEEAENIWPILFSFTNFTTKTQNVWD